MPVKSFIGSFEKIRPKFEVPQEVLLGWMARAHLQTRLFAEGRETPVSKAPPEELAKMQKFVSRFACDPSKISARGIHTDDAYELNYEKMQIYKISPKSLEGSKMLDRTEFFSKACNQVFEEFYPEGHPQPEHIIHVTCTGYVSPSGAQQVVAKRHWNSQVTHAYHMGCYASLPAIRIAQAFSMNQNVEVIHTELCSLHLNPSNHSPEQIVVQSLFADGFIKYQVSTTPSSFEILKIKEFIIPDSGNMMTWLTSDFGMQMSLSKEVPTTIARHLANFIEDFQIDFENTIFAIHPGGPRIIDSIQDLLKLPEEKVAHAKSVLYRYGNMSSATLPHIWQDISNDPNVIPGTKIMSLAFGPGLTIFGGLLQKI